MITSLMRRGALLYDAYTPPKEYTPVDWIQSTGQLAHIDTGVSGVSTLRIRLTAKVIDYYQYAAFCGNYTTSADTRWRIIQGGTNVVYANVQSTSSVILNAPSGSIVNNKITLDVTAGSASITDSAGTASGTTTTGGTANTSRLALCCYKVQPSATGTGTYKCRYYGCEIWDSGKLIRHFTPCVRNNDSVAGMWDGVNKAFYPSCSNYAFEYGND